MSNGENLLGKFLARHKEMSAEQRKEAAKPPLIAEDIAAIQKEFEEIAAKNRVTFENADYSFFFSPNSPEAITPSDKILVKKDFLTFFKSLEWDTVFPRSLDQPISLRIVFKRDGVVRYLITVDRGGRSSENTTREVDTHNKKS